jgi:hypothetical protein
MKADTFKLKQDLANFQQENNDLKQAVHDLMVATVNGAGKNAAWSFNRRIIDKVMREWKDD